MELKDLKSDLELFEGETRFHMKCVDEELSILEKKIKKLEKSIELIISKEIDGRS